MPWLRSVQYGRVFASRFVDDFGPDGNNTCRRKICKVRRVLVTTSRVILQQRFHPEQLLPTERMGAKGCMVPHIYISWWIACFNYSANCAPQCCTLQFSNNEIITPTVQLTLLLSNPGNPAATRTPAARELQSRISYGGLGTGLPDACKARAVTRFWCA